MTYNVEIKKSRGKFFAFAGSVKLTRGFATEAAARAEFDGNVEFYTYWANSAGVSIQNTPAITIAA